MTAETNKIALHQPKNNLQAWQNAAEKIKEGRNDLPKTLEGDAGSWSGMTPGNHRHDASNHRHDARQHAAMNAMQSQDAAGAVGCPFRDLWPPMAT